MRLELMRSWLKALVVLAALIGGTPTAAWAHAGHGHGNQTTIRQDTDIVPQALPSGSSFASRVLVATSARGTGDILPCCCQGAAAACASSAAGTLFGVQSPRTWYLVASARLSG